MALGASAGSIAGLVMRRAGTMAASGVVLGVGAGFAASRLLASVLYQTSRWDPASVGAAAAILVVTALAASYLPARRAARVDPARALVDG
jgi:putative ABC transport system permease protein